MNALKNALLDNGLFEYEVKPSEILWALLQGGAAFVMATSTAPVSPSDWQAWGIGLAGALARPVFAVIFGRRPAGT